MLHAAGSSVANAKDRRQSKTSSASLIKLNGLNLKRNICKLQEDFVWMVAVPTFAGHDTPNHRNQSSQSNPKKEHARQCTVRYS